jgi:hypothetical protein
MATRADYYVKCDRCGEADGWSKTAGTARYEVRRLGWIRKRDEKGYMIDLCWRCAERESGKQQQEVQA